MKMKTLLEMLAAVFALDRSVETLAADNIFRPGSCDSRRAEALLACEYDHNAQLYLDLYSRYSDEHHSFA